MTSLKTPPNGGKVRPAEPRPWEALGISRATYYRKGKPTQLPTIRWKQADQARVAGGVSLRTVQRSAFIKRYGIADLYYLAHLYGLPSAVSMGMLEEVAKWSHRSQHRFMENLVIAARVPPLGTFSWVDERDREKAKGAPMAYAVVLLGRDVRRAAHTAFHATVIEMFAEE